jgi:hypothetical protein
LSLGHWLRALPRIVPAFGFAFDTASDTVKPWWQDTIFLLSLLLTPLAIAMTWSTHPWFTPLGIALCGYFLFDALIYHMRVLWFDDLRPGIPDSRRGVSSHCRILFVAIFSFIQSVFLFASLYRAIPGLSGESYAYLLARSFSTATLLSLSQSQ